MCPWCADGWPLQELWGGDKPLHSLQVRVSDSSARFYGKDCTHHHITLLRDIYISVHVHNHYMLNLRFHSLSFAAHVHRHLGAA